MKGRGKSALPVEIYAPVFIAYNCSTLSVILEWKTCCMRQRA